MCSFQTNYPYYHGFYASYFGLLDQFGCQSLFPVAHFGCWTLISEAIAAGWTKVAAKISNWLGTRSHRSHLSGALLTSGSFSCCQSLVLPSQVFFMETVTWSDFHGP